VSAENNDNLLEAWREVREALERFPAGPLDEIEQQRRDVLQTQEAALAVRVRAAGLIPERVEPRAGMWAPLPLHDGPPTPTSSDEVVFSEPQNNHEPYEAIAHRVAALYSGPSRRRNSLRALKTIDASRLGPRGAQVVAAAFEDLDDEFTAHSLRRRHQLPYRELGPRTARAARPAAALPFIPDDHDGLTGSQRRLVRVLAAVFPGALTHDELFERTERSDDLTFALTELLRPRPYPLVQSEGVKRLRLSSVTMEMIDRLPDGKVKVHGGFFPNLLVNGCTEPFAFPTHQLGEVVAATKLMATKPGVTDLELMSALPGPDFVDGLTCAPPRSLYGTGRGHLELLTQVTFETATIVRLEHFLPGVAAQQILATIAAGVEQGAIVGLVRSTEVATGVVQYEVEHPAFARAVLRHLDRASLLRQQWPVAFTFRGESGEPITGWLGHVLHTFFHRTKRVITERLMAEEALLTSQLGQGSFVAAPDVQRIIEQVLDVSLDQTEAVWALMHLGTEALRAHPAFKTIATEGVMPLSEADARRALRPGRARAPSGRSELDRLALTSRIADLQERIRSPSSLQAAVFSELDRVVAQYGGRPRRTVLSPRSGGLEAQLLL